jgi:hypothetical protein
MGMGWPQVGWGQWVFRTEIARDLSAAHVCGRLGVFDLGVRAWAFAPLTATLLAQAGSQMKPFMHNGVQSWTNRPKVE